MFQSCRAVPRGRRLATVLAVCAAVTLSLAAPAAAASRPSPVRAGGLAASAGAKPQSSLPVRDIAPIAGGDEIVEGRGDSDGWHLYAASSGNGWSWQPLATLAPAGLDPNGERWTGRQCLTGDGRYVVAVVAPWGADNTPAGADRGGIAYVVDAHTGAVRPLIGGVSLYYFTPSCGAAGTVALTRYAGTNNQATEVVLTDAASAAVTKVVALTGQYTNAVPAGDGGLFAVSGDTIVHLSHDGHSTRTRTSGQPFDLVGNAAGGVDYLLGTDRSTAAVWRLDNTGNRRTGGGVFEQLALFEGRGGHSLAAGTTGLDPSAGITAVAGTNAVIDATSLDGTAYSPAPTQAVDSSSAARVNGALPRTPLLLSVAQAHGARRLESWLPSSAAPSAVTLPPTLRDDGTIVDAHGAVSVPGTGATAARTAAPAASAQFTSTCAVARNDVYLQAMQPSPEDVAWAANLAGRSLLTGSAARPAGVANLGLPGYSPSQDFPLPAPFGPGGQSIPREVLEAIVAQESNFNQASWHSVQGVAGNPFIADYYGAAGGYAAGVVTPDCGYGLGQVTTGMHVGDMSYDLQRKVAVDYAENVAAAAQILAQKWNELSAAGITANTNDPSVLEDWYLAIWDYNSGLHPNTGSGPYGLGWTNNPANPNYPYNRHPFLHQDSGNLLPPSVTYGDASTPANWSYQEKVFGWMEVPLKSPMTGNASYYGLIQSFDPLTGNDQINVPWIELARPGVYDFCATGQNACDPTVCSRSTYGSTCNPATTDGTGPCTRTDYECWWHTSDTWCQGTVSCHTGTWEYQQGDAEPPFQSADYYPLPACAVDTAAVPSGTVIVDSQAAAVNFQGCTSANENWHNAGTFAFTYGDPANPAAQQTDMDVHQLGAGLGGHIWFTHTNEPTDANGLSYWGVTGTWTPNLPSLGNYTIKVYVPSAGASSTQATYSIDPGYGSASAVTINQNAYSNTWVSLGTFWLGEHANVSLTNLSTTAGGDLAFSGMAFVPAWNPTPYAILGDSYSSGEGTNNYDPDTNTSSNTCHRSPDSFGRVYAAGSSAFVSGDVEHLACSGATIDNILTTPRNGEPPQISELSGNARLVTVTIGGNDAGFASVLKRCIQAAATRTACEDYYSQNDSNNLSDTIDALEASLVTTYKAIHTRAPSASVVAVTYPNIFMPGASKNSCANIGFISDSDVAWLIEVAQHLDDVIAKAAAEAGIGVLDERYAFVGHELCTPTPWVNGLLDGLQNLDLSSSFHPNAAGYQQIAADLSGFVTTATATTPPWRWGHPTFGIPNLATAKNMLIDTLNPDALINAQTPRVDHGYTANGGEALFNIWGQDHGCNIADVIRARDGDNVVRGGPNNCWVVSGTWQSPYDLVANQNVVAHNRDEVTGNSTAVPPVAQVIQIDHVVNLHDAFDMGASGWSAEQRNEFGNDMVGPETLTSSASINRTKSDQTIDTWIPPNPNFECTYAKMYTAIKYTSHLKVTPEEYNTLRNILFTVC